MPGTYNSSFFCRAPYTKCYSVNTTNASYADHSSSCRRVYGGRKVVYKWVPPHPLAGQRGQSRNRKPPGCQCRLGQGSPGRFWGSQVFGSAQPSAASLCRFRA
jgi:hypothetical protein